MNIPGLEETYKQLANDYRNGIVHVKYHDDNTIYFINVKNLKSEPCESSEGKAIRVDKKCFAEILRVELSYTAEEIENAFRFEWFQNEKMTGEKVPLMNYEAQQYINTLKV